MPGHPDVVAIHATRFRNAVPFLSEVTEQANAVSNTSSSGPAGRVRFVLAVTNGIQPTATTGASFSGNKIRTPAVKSEETGEGAMKKTGFYVVEGRPDADLIVREVPDVAARHVLLCGPDAFMVAMDQTLRTLGVAPSFVHSEEFYF